MMMILMIIDLMSIIIMISNIPNTHLTISPSTEWYKICNIQYPPFLNNSRQSDVGQQQWLTDCKKWQIFHYSCHLTTCAINYTECIAWTLNIIVLQSFFSQINFKLNNARFWLAMMEREEEVRGKDVIFKNDDNMKTSESGK